MNCYHCYGNGEVKCLGCSEEGLTENKEHCQGCQGNGIAACSRCNGSGFLESCYENDVVELLKLTYANPFFSRGR